MTDAPDLEQLARRYFDLWQDQAAAMISDPALAEMTARGYSLLGAILAAAAGGGPEKGTAFADANAPTSGFRDIPAGAAPVAAASVDPALDPVRLSARLAALEERIVRLEAILAAGGGGVAKASRNRRS